MIHVAAQVPEVWEAYTDTDLVEGRGSKVVLGYFTKQLDAKEAAKGEGVMGTDAHVTKIKTPSFMIFESIEEYRQNTRKELRKIALAKLSYEEKVALGLDPTEVK